ncbi:MAG TPA: alpha/beta hydrolase-fold protein [Chitinophagaceae bacterium]|nr:alpha/beta hydrolase-fold protein [Chitinophagaceae bacterium]
MKILILIYLFLSIFLSSVVAQQNNLLTIGTIHNIHSGILHGERQIWVHLPPSAGLDKKKKYPVIYLQDGEKNFASVAGMVDFLSSVWGNNVCPEMIVVGIPNTNRIRDLTPTKVTSGLWIDSITAANSGGGEAFMAFIEKELIPHIDSLYPSMPYRILIGHSLGGIMVINTLMHHTKLFKGYIAIDPSMWWDQQRLLHEAARTMKTNAYPGETIFLAMANTLPIGMDTTSIQTDTTSGTIHSRSILQLSRYLLGNKNGLKASFKYYADESHTTSPLPATYDGLHFIFKDYTLSYPANSFTDSTFPLASFLKEHYAVLSSEYLMFNEDGSALLPPEDVVNNAGYFMMSQKQFTKAEDLFKMNIQNYPSGAVAYRYLGDLYAAKGDNRKAIENYKKSLSLKEDIETKKKLSNLTGY